MHIGLLLFNFVHLQTLATQNAEKCFDEIQSVNETEKILLHWMFKQAARIVLKSNNISKTKIIKV